MPRGAQNQDSGQTSRQDGPTTGQSEAYLASRGSGVRVQLPRSGLLAQNRFRMPVPARNLSAGGELLRAGLRRSTNVYIATEPD
jgi:hypothetical protein